MNTEHVHEQLIALLSGNLDPQDEEAVKAHLDSCAGCREEFQSLRLTWESLGKVPAEQPSGALRTRFYDMLKLYEAMDRAPSHRRPSVSRFWLDRFLPRSPAVGFAVVLVVLIIGAVAGYELKSSQVNSLQLAQLHEEISGMNRLLTVSLLQQESAAERLQGVSWSYRLQGPDPEVRAALLTTLKHDANVNVRLAALDAISRSFTEPAVRREVMNALPAQTSPLVQIAIVDILVQFNEKQSIEIFKHMLTAPGVDKSVKQKLEQGLQKLI